MPCKDDIKRLALCFEKILAGDDPKIALGLGGKQSQGRGRRHGSELYKKEIFPIFQVEILRTEGLTLESAISQVSNKEGIPYDTLVRYHKRWRKGVTSQIQARLANDYPLPCLEQMSAWKIENAGRMFTCFEKNHKKKNSKKDKAPGETMK